ncbi:site-specific DNA-methyltransferase [Candidatus Dependentiae bacterium]|nr:site-specific DNA-methyltransferase [Candidatus Dependentiae bacterium]
MAIRTIQEWKIDKRGALHLLPGIPDKSVQLILTDLPYGSTNCAWDTPIDLKRLWPEYKRIIKKDDAVVLTASQPFTSVLVMSNIDMFRYEWIWEKDRPSNINCADIQPMKYHENILIFGKGRIKYNPQKIERTSSRVADGIRNKNIVRAGFKDLNSKPNYKEYSFERYDPDFKNPSTLLYHPRKQNGIHPAQKPIPLFEYLINTYTDEGDYVHDSCLGSGTTLEACVNLNRNFIGFEITDKWEWNYHKIMDRKKNMYQLSRIFKREL